MPPIIRNTLIRLTALIEQISRGSLKLLNTLFGGFAQLAGLKQPSYYVEEAQQNQANSQSAQPQPTVESTSSRAIASSRRQTGSEEDYFRKMAQQISQQK